MLEETLTDDRRLATLALLCEAGFHRIYRIIELVDIQLIPPLPWESGFFLFILGWGRSFICK